MSWLESVSGECLLETCSRNSQFTVKNMCYAKCDDVIDDLNWSQNIFLTMPFGAKMCKFLHNAISWSMYTKVPNSYSFPGALLQQAASTLLANAIPHIQNYLRDENSLSATSTRFLSLPICHAGLCATHCLATRKLITDLLATLTD